MTDFNWTATFGEVKTAAQWTDLGDNDRALQDGTGINDGAILPEHLIAGAGTSWAWQSFTPNWTGSAGSPSIGNGTFTGQYVKVGKIVFVQFSFTGGSTTNWGGASGYYIDYPVTAAAKYNTTSGGWCLNGYLEDLASVAYSVHGARTFNSTKFQVQMYAPQTASVNVWSYNAPFTWATGDFWMASGFYEAAS